MVTLADVLEMDVIRRGAPAVVAGQQGLTRLVRWVTVLGASSCSRTLRPNDLLITCSDAFADDVESQRRMIQSMAESGVSGLVVLSGHGHAGTLPICLVRSAEQYQLPLITCGHPTSLREVTEAIGRTIFSRQLQRLTELDEIHRTFNELSLEGANTWQVVQHMAEIARCPVVLESLSHQILAYEAAGYTRDILEDWEEVSRRIRTAGRTFYDASTGWLSTAVGARGTDWGRVLMLAPKQEQQISLHPNEDVLVATLECGAATLAMNKMTIHFHVNAERRAHAELLGSILSHSLMNSEVALRAKSMGLPLDRGSLVGLAVRHRPTALPRQGTEVRQLEDTVRTALHRHKMKGLVATVDDAVAILLVLGTRGDQALETMTTGLQQAHRQLIESTRRTDIGRQDELIIAAGSLVTSMGEARTTLTQAISIAATAHRTHLASPREFHYQFRDLHVSGLLDQLRNDSRLQSYVEQEIGPLLDHDARRGTDLTAVLAAYLQCGRNKTAAAESAGMSRPSFYDRLDRIERVLSVDLDDLQSCFSLHVAVQALEAIRPPDSPEELREAP
ncbi:PucR family transcriptional regulator [Streptomyces sp. NPDC048479]|uniref:PucR family transcriptional regulator n=1 Tax=Streptomyces sp. NPDC048479 TaxID=3154725 RepID=UPI003420705A